MGGLGIYRGRISAVTERRGSHTQIVLQNIGGIFVQAASGVHGVLLFWGGCVCDSMDFKGLCVGVRAYFIVDLKSFG